MRPIFVLEREVVLSGSWPAGCAEKQIIGPHHYSSRNGLHFSRCQPNLGTHSPQSQRSSPDPPQRERSWPGIMDEPSIYGSRAIDFCSPSSSSRWRCSRWGSFEGVMWWTFLLYIYIMRVRAGSRTVAFESVCVCQGNPEMSRDGPASGLFRVLFPSLDVFRSFSFELEGGKRLRGGWRLL